jgi:hypothetical protein
VLLPEFVPLPDAVGSLVRQAIAELVRQHQDLPAMVGLVGKMYAK